MSTQQARAAYRAILRELPRRPLQTPSPLHQRIRIAFREPVTKPETKEEISEELSLRLAEAQEVAKYARAQRMYAVLVERYNPGINMDEEDKIRLTARRVGLDLPVDQQQHSGQKE